MLNDRQITISIGESRKSVDWKKQVLMLSELWDRLALPVRSTETMAEYLQLPKGEQDNRKDVGGFVGGELNGPRRKAGSIAGRDVLTLDLDSIPPYQAEAVIKRADGLGPGYCIYSTRKHRPDAPRLRVLIPLDRTATADEYEAVARRTAEWIGMEYMDPTTFEPHRLMYYGSCCSDGEWVFHTADKPFLSVDGTLATYNDWRDRRAWPIAAGEEKRVRDSQKRQQDPVTKGGVVGAFCRAYDVPAAMAAFIPGTYEEAGEGRYTFTGGSTTGGAVLYEGGKFLFSHHATDPCGGQLVNAWDLVRIHKFGHLDDEAQPGTRGQSLPSFQAMVGLAREDPAVAELMAREAFGAVSTAAGVEATDREAGVELAKLQGEPLSERVLDLALQACGVTVRVNDITGDPEIEGLPPQYLQQAALNVLHIFLSDVLKRIGIKGASPTAIKERLPAIFAKVHYNPVVQMMDTTVWDGEDRFPVVLDILGLDHNSFDAVLVRKWLIQCVALARNGYGSGYGADGVLTLQGPQAAGKTTFFRRLAVKSQWFAEGVVLDKTNKDSQLQATAAWIAELGELDDTLRKEQAWLKSFLTQTEDRIRRPYAVAPEPRPRRTSFCATVNPDGFLWDPSGNRRFWTVQVDHIDLDRLLSLPEVWFSQLWAEANTWWAEANQGFRLTREELAQLEAVNEGHRKMQTAEEEILDLLDFSIPPSEWEEFTAGELLRLGQFGSLSRFNAVQVGKALQSICQRYKGVTFRPRHGRTVYRLPHRRTIGLAESTNQGAS